VLHAPNVGGITQFLKIMALCETHVVGMVPHFTGPISTAALLNCLATFPGLDATLEMKLLKPIGEVTQPIRRQIYHW
jgi:L-alanine-DL-glutamate epimerase-like enolase superfamily enzyme